MQWQYLLLSLYESVSKMRAGFGNVFATSPEGTKNRCFLLGSQASSSATMVAPASTPLRSSWASLSWKPITSRSDFAILRFVDRSSGGDSSRPFAGFPILMAYFWGQPFWPARLWGGIGLEGLWGAFGPPRPPSIAIWPLRNSSLIFDRSGGRAPVFETLSYDNVIWYYNIIILWSAMLVE